MIEWDRQANALFLEARELAAGPERDAFLDDACRQDEALLARVAALLNANEQASDFLRSPVEHLMAAESPLRGKAGPGTLVGPYELLQEIGEGGIGVVYMAKQLQPVRRNVAIKIIKPGMDSRQVIARFEAERQALALMDHPNISKVLDGGATDTGRPYFVMELVPSGLPITRYCEEHSLFVLHRLRLFITVCHAVQHAHQKGVIHRDLKPSNVLVALYDGAPIVKVIDFGIAKATGPKLTERTMFTELGTMLGTLEYMSPEQAELNQLDIDTRSDVYSLGVILYELLTGSTPIDSQRLRTASFDELRRLIREEVPARPSDYLKRTTTLEKSATSRNIEPHKLSYLVCGDLDWIVMKALEKDRTRRYETADALGRDLERYLVSEPIEARPPTAAYRLQKFAYRYRGPVSAAILLALALLIGIGVSTSQAVRASRAERLALANAAQAEKAAAGEAAERAKAEQRLKFLIFAVGAGTSELNDENVADLIDRSTKDFESTYITAAPEAMSTMLLSIGRSFANSGRYDAAERNLRKSIALASHPRVIHDAKYELGLCLLRLGQVDEATSLLEGIFRYKVEHCSGTDVDQLLAALPGVSDAANTSVEQFGQEGLEFDGIDDYVVVPNLQFDGHPPWTLEVIVNAAEIDQFPSRSPNKWTSLISTTEGGGIGLESNRGKWSLGLYAAHLGSENWEENYVSAFARATPNFDRWEHVAGVWDGAELRLYVDGKLQEKRQGATKCTAISEGPFMLGADPVGMNNGAIAEGLFHGRFRAVRISHVAEYTDEFSRPEHLDTTPQTLALYNFTIDSGRYAVDRSGHGHHGIIVGAKFVKPVSK